MLHDQGVLLLYNTALPGQFVIVRLHRRADLAAEAAVACVRAFDPDAAFRLAVHLVLAGRAFAALKIFQVRISYLKNFRHVKKPEGRGKRDEKRRRVKAKTFRDSPALIT